MLAHFIDAVANGTAVEPCGATFLDGLRAAQVAEAVTEAASTGCQVEVTHGELDSAPGRKQR